MQQRLGEAITLLVLTLCEDKESISARFGYFLQKHALGEGPAFCADCYPDLVLLLLQRQDKPKLMASPNRCLHISTFVLNPSPRTLKAVLGRGWNFQQRFLVIPCAVATWSPITFGTFCAANPPMPQLNCLPRPQNALGRFL